MSDEKSPSSLYPLGASHPSPTAPPYVLIWPGETVRIAIDFSIPYPGPQQYVFHCHNLEHEDEGMMVNYKVM
jgi:FtsP/CotA-like multicopper oxidase with cupredoxin domain